MRAFEIRDAFGMENLRLVERPAPEPEHRQVRIRMRAASLNYRDLLMIRGLYNPRQPLPLVPLSDGVGVVEAVGPGVSRVSVGDRVAGIFSQRWISNPPSLERVMFTLGGPLDGMLTESIVLDEDGVVAVPEYLTDVEAATLPCAALTAWSALAVEGRLRPGDTVLVLGTGGVSIFALQIARLFGASVIVTSSSDEKLARAADLGAAHGINYRTHPKWAREVSRITGGRGVDHVIEVGGAGTFDQSVRAARIGGHISMIGVLAGGSHEVNLTRVLMHSITVQGVMVGCRDSFEAMNRAFALHEVRPVIDSVFDFEDTSAALAHLASAKHFGKVAIRFPD